MEIEIITPEVADEGNVIDVGLVAITRAISEIDEDKVSHGILGGTYGYGAHWDNDVFTMRPFYWGDCDCGSDEREAAWDADPRNRHAADCYQRELQKRKKAAGLSYIDCDEHKFIDVDSDLDYDEMERRREAIYRVVCEKYNLDPEVGAAVHCTCDYRRRWEEYIAVNGHRPTCSLELPNFLHKRTGLEVRWYKWIGRGMEVKNADGVDLQAVFAECLASLKQDGKKS